MFFIGVAHVVSFIMGKVKIGLYFYLRYFDKIQVNIVVDGPLIPNFMCIFPNIMKKVFIFSQM